MSKESLPVVDVWIGDTKEGDMILETGAEMSALQVSAEFYLEGGLSVYNIGGRERGEEPLYAVRSKDV